MEPEYLDERTVEEELAYRRFRVEYDGLSGPWIDLLMARPAVLCKVAEETAWTVEEIIEGETSAYAVVKGTVSIENGGVWSPAGLVVGGLRRRCL